MIFTSLKFFYFFLVVYLFYLLLEHKWQNRMLLVASYVFYGAWDWRFLSLFVLVTFINYICGLKIDQAQNQKERKIFLFIGVFVSLVILGFFKYFNFFIAGFYDLLKVVGLGSHPPYFNIILPLGISFYTFQAMSYTIDVYYRQMKPAGKFWDFALFVSFFPQLVAGPIERASHLLPQVLNPRKINSEKFYSGCFLILWGVFLKVCVASSLAKIVNLVFSGSPPYEGSQVMIGLYAFAFQILCDFDGYSNIARGLAKLMGFELMINFNSPYFVTNPQEFWRRWHISLSTWLRDYLYIPLGGNRKGVKIMCRNLFLTMFLGGLWHGAAWTFVLWGVYHGFLLIFYHLYKGVWVKQKKSSSFGVAVKTVVFFHLVCLGWLLFRAQSMDQVFQMLNAVIFNFKLDWPILRIEIVELISVLWILWLVQWVTRKQNDILIVRQWPRVFKWSLYVVIIYSFIVNGGKYGGEEFIYFVF